MTKPPTHTLPADAFRADRHHDEGEEESMGRLNKWAEHVEECLRMVDSNREQNDTVHEIILRHLGVDMSQAGNPPRMNAEQIAAALGVEWPKTHDPDTIELRLARLEERINIQTDCVTILVDHNTSHFARIGVAETQVDDLADRIERLEAWTRNEIFARTAMDEPEPERQSVSDEDGGKIVRDVWIAYAREHGDTKPSHLTEWDELPEYDKEVDRRIFRAVRVAITAAKETPHE